MFPVQPGATIHQGLAHAERQLFALQIDDRAEPDHIATRRLGLRVGRGLDEP